MSPPAPTKFSAWIWSDEYQKHYCASYDDRGTMVGYIWASAPGTAPSEAQQATFASPEEPRLKPTIAGVNTAHYGSSNTLTGGYTTDPTNVQTSPSTHSTQSTKSYPQLATASVQRQAQHTQISGYNGGYWTQSPQSRQEPISPAFQPSGYHASYAPAGNTQSAYPHSYQPITAYSKPNQTTNVYSSQPPYNSAAQTSLFPQPSGQTFPQSSQIPPSDLQSTVGSINPRRHIKTGSDSRNEEPLDPSYRRVISEHIPYFFVRGRVFKMLWIEPAGQTAPGKTRGSTHFSVVKYGETAYAEIRRFVVINNRGKFSQCIPIQTYRGQGATKGGLRVEDHGIVYTGDEDTDPPALLHNEGITKTPIRVNSTNGETLDPESRINFGKPYAVEHNVKVMDIGMIAPEHTYLLVNYFQTAMGF